MILSDGMGESGACIEICSEAGLAYLFTSCTVVSNLLLSVFVSLLISN